MIFSQQPTYIKPIADQESELKGLIAGLDDYLVSPIAKVDYKTEGNKAVIKLNNGITLLAKISDTQDKMFQLFQVRGENRLEITSTLFEQNLS